MAQNFDINLAKALEVAQFRTDKQSRGFSVSLPPHASARIAKEVYTVPSGYTYYLTSYFLAIYNINQTKTEANVRNTTCFIISAPEEITVPTSVGLKILKMYSTDFGMCIDDDNEVYTWDGSSWTQQTAPTASPVLNDLAIYSSTNACVAGDEGLLWFWNGTSLSNVTSSTYALYDFDYIDVHIPTRYIIASNLRAGGASQVLHYNATANSYAAKTHGNGATNLIMAVAAIGANTEEWAYILDDAGTWQEGLPSSDNYLDIIGAPYYYTDLAVTRNGRFTETNDNSQGRSELTDVYLVGVYSGSATGARTFRYADQNIYARASATTINTTINATAADTADLNQVEAVGSFMAAKGNPSCSADSCGLFVYNGGCVVNITPQTWLDYSYTINYISLFSELGREYIYVAVTTNQNTNKIYRFIIDQLWTFRVLPDAQIQEKTTPVPTIQMSAGSSLWITTYQNGVSFNAQGYLDTV